MSDARLLALDIDGTLIGKGDRPTAGLETLGIVLDARREHVRLVYATGRSFASVWSLVEADVLPRPDAVAAFVGTELWMPPWEARDAGFRERIEADWDLDGVMEVLRSFEGLTPQPAEVQTPWKASFYLPDESLIPRVEAALKAEGLRAAVLYSAGAFLDVIPERAGKRAAVMHLRGLWGIDPGHVLVGGDSGNDLDMLKDPRLAAVAVGNAQEEVRDLSEDEGVYQAELPYAAGVLEGAEEHGFWADEGSGDESSR
jgi:sucrose-6F-phosphate phosphohydrolase